MIAPIPSPHNPYVPANWRWARARWLRGPGKGRPSTRDDRYTLLCREYQAARSRARSNRDFEKLEDCYPGIHWAWEMSQNNVQDKKWVLEAFLLSRATPAQISQHLMISTDIILWYEKLFFNVWPYLDHDLYIITTVMRSSIHYGLSERDYDLLWKMIGFAMGPIALRHIILPLSPVWVASEDQLKSAGQVQIDAQTSRKMLIGTRTVPVWNNQQIIFEAYNRSREIELGMGRTGQSESMIFQNIQQALTACRFHIGAPLPNQRMAYDNSGVELRASEQIELAITGKSATADNLLSYRFPEPTSDGNPPN